MRIQNNIPMRLVNHSICQTSFYFTFTLPNVWLLCAYHINLVVQNHRAVQACRVVDEGKFSTGPCLGVRDEVTKSNLIGINAKIGVSLHAYTQDKRVCFKAGKKRSIKFAAKCFLLCYEWAHSDRNECLRSGTINISKKLNNYKKFACFPAYDVFNDMRASNNTTIHLKFEIPNIDRHKP